MKPRLPLPRVAVLEREPGVRVAISQAGVRSGAPLMVVATPARLRAELAWFGVQAAVLDFPRSAEHTSMDLVRELSSASVPVIVWTANTRAALRRVGLIAPVVSRSSDPDANLVELLEEVRRQIAASAPRPWRGSARWR